MNQEPSLEPVVTPDISGEPELGFGLKLVPVLYGEARLASPGLAIEPLFHDALAVVMYVVKLPEAVSAATELVPAVSNAFVVPNTVTPAICILPASMLLAHFEPSSNTPAEGKPIRAEL